MGRILNASQFAEIIGVSPQTVKNMTDAGELRKYQASDGSFGYREEDKVIVFDKKLRKATENGVKGVLYINIDDARVSSKYVKDSNMSAYYVNNISELLTALSTVVSNDITTMDDERLADFYTSYRVAVLNEFIKRYVSAADKYYNRLVKLYEGLSLIPAKDLKDCILYGKSLRGIAQEDFEKLFDCTRDEDSYIENKESKEPESIPINMNFGVVQSHMNNVFGKLAFKLDINKYSNGKTIKVISRDNIDEAFLQKSGRYYHSLIVNNHFTMTDDKNNVTQAILASVIAKQAKIKSDDFFNEKLRKGFYTIVDVSKDMSFEDRLTLFNTLGKGYYNEIHINVAESDVKELVPESILFRLKELALRRNYSVSYEGNPIEEA